jgi:general secretion pathway protein L
MTAAARLPTFASPSASVRRFLAWWSKELSDAIATTARRSRAWKVLFLRGEKGCDVYVRTRDRAELVGTSGAGGDLPLAELRWRLGRQEIAPTEIVLRLRPGEVVHARLNVPSAAGEVLEPIVRNQIERLAPWPADKALFGYQVTPASDGSATLDVALAIAGRGLVEGLVSELGAVGLAPGVVDFGTDAAAEPRLNLLAAGGGRGHGPGRRLLAWVGLACLGALVAGAIGVALLVQQTRELDALSARLEEVRAQSAALLPSQMGERRRAWLVAQKGSQPSMAVVMEALSRALPDDAWLTRLEAEQGVVRLAGNAANAAALIRQIEASGHFTDVKFSAPTTRTEEDNQESFTITGRIEAGRKLD